MATLFQTLGESLVIGLTVSFFALTATTVYLHRTVSHRALSMRYPVALLFRAIVWITTGIKPRQWAAVHRKHHAYTDIEGDPHSPVLLGWKKVQRGNVLLYRNALSDPGILDRYARDVRDDAWDRMLFNRNYSGLVSGIALLVILFGPVKGLLAAFIHANFYLAGNAGVNALGHHFGKRPYANLATNLQWLAFLTMGEGLHNNHHAAPSSPRLSHRRGEVDPGWWVIRILAALGLAKLRFADIRLGARARAGAV